MRIVIDYQGAQTGSRYRGIGRYTKSLVKAMIRHGTECEFIVVLNGNFASGIDSIRADLDDVLPQSQIRVWQSPGPVGYADSAGQDLRHIAELVREHYLRSLEPDVILVTSLFEGLGDDAVLSIKRTSPEIPVACIFYDLTPLIMPDVHFRNNPLHRRWYRDRIESLKKSDLLLAISESSRGEALSELGIAPDKVVNIFGAHDPNFAFKNFGESEKRAVRERFGLTRPFILYAGGLELNKNLRRLIEGLSYTPASIREGYTLVCAGKRNSGEADMILSFAQDSSVRQMISVVGHVSEADLVDLYNSCDLFVFPSLREGFGLPALEAMACGAPTIVSNTTSLPEVVGNPDATFDPTSPQEIGAKISLVLGDTDFRLGLIKSGLDRAATLSWDVCAGKALNALSRYDTRRLRDAARKASVIATGIFAPRTANILVQKLDHHGDFFLGLPAMAKLRARYPHAQIDALVGSWNRDAAVASGLFDTIYTLDYFQAKSSDRPNLDDAQLGVFADMPYYDYAIDLRRQPDTRFVLFKANANAYFGYKTGDETQDDLLTAALSHHPDIPSERGYFDSMHVCEQLLRIIDALPFDVNDYLHLPKMGERLSIRPGSIAIFPRVGLDARQWDSERFGQLIENLVAAESVTEINIYAGKVEELAVIPLPEHAKIKIQCGLRFGDLYTSLSGNQVCVGNNSFGVHLASYAGCKTIGIYSGHELAQQWGPAFGDAEVIMIDAACAPCHLPTRESCPFNVFCLEDISVRAVTDLVLAKVVGTKVSTYHAQIQASNPASAVAELITDINTLKIEGQIEALSPAQKIALTAAIARNFPERIGSGFTVYIDISSFLSDGDDQARKTQSQWDFAVGLIESLTAILRPNYTVTTIASSQHDHEFYTVPLDQVEDLPTFLHRAPVVMPIAGDIYLGIDSYLFRTTAQWDLLYSWRALGVTTAFLLPADDLHEWNFGKGGSDRARLMATFLWEAMHFDHLIVQSDRIAGLDEWIRKNAPIRARPIALDYLGASKVTDDATSLRDRSISAQQALPARLAQLLVGRHASPPPRRARAVTRSR